MVSLAAGALHVYVLVVVGLIRDEESSREDTVLICTKFKLCMFLSVIAIGTTKLNSSAEGVCNIMLMDFCTVSV